MHFIKSLNLKYKREPKKENIRSLLVFEKAVNIHPLPWSIKIRFITLVAVRGNPLTMSLLGVEYH